MKNFCRNYLGNIITILLFIGLFCVFIGGILLSFNINIGYWLIGIGVCPLIIVFILMVLSIFINHWFFCYTFGWHKAPKEQYFNGFNLSGKCPVCGEDVMKDSQGNWF